MSGERAVRVGLIGSGIIAASRVPALRTAGLEVTAVASRPGSRSVQAFARDHAIPQVLADWRELIEHSELWDALVISTWPDGTPEVLETALEEDGGTPILVEKPVAWNTARHQRILRLPHENVIVGYNRRFYASVQRARKECVEGEPLLAQLNVPTVVPVPKEHDPSGRYLQQFYESASALGIDLTRFVLGDVHVESVMRRTTDAGNIAGLAAILSTERGDVLQMTCNWGTPANYSLTLSWPGRRFELLPFEIGTLYEGMEVIPPSPEYAIRRYLPKPAERIGLQGVDLEQKPGFVGEAHALAAMVRGEPAPAFAARLEDALAVTSLCERLTGVVLSDFNPSPYHN
jgi:predicted dehydrogenase